MNPVADILWQGRLPPHRVHCRPTGLTYTPPDHLLPPIDAAWHAGLAQGKHLFDGPMVRLDHWQTAPDALHLHLGTLTFKPFFALHMARPDLLPTDDARRPNPLGVSAVLRLADSRLVMGRRSGRVAYYPARIHPIAGAMEPRDADPFAAALREISEELHLTQPLPAAAHLIALLRDPLLRQPEAVILLDSPLTADQIHPAGPEHDHLHLLHPAEPPPPDLTPVALGVLQQVAHLDLS